MARTKRSAKKASVEGEGAAKKGLASKSARKEQPSLTGVKKYRRWRPGTAALRQIRKLQKSSNLLIRKAPFQRLVRALTPTDTIVTRWQRSALLAVQVIAALSLGFTIRNLFLERWLS